MTRTIDSLLSGKQVVISIAEGRFDDFLSKIPENYRKKVLSNADQVFRYVNKMTEMVETYYETAPKNMRLKERFSEHGRKTAEKEKKPIPPIHREPGEDYHLVNDQKPNGFGGYADVNIGMYNGEKLVRQITDETGNFLDFPGVEHGKWEEELKFPFQKTVRFTVSLSRFRENGLADFFWMVQPDGRYWADDDGFGMENDMEIRLSAKIDKTGRFVTPFAWKK